jgi:DNA-directed RNA polymerase specialized sigma24 family protein
MSPDGGVHNFDYDHWLAVAARHARRRQEATDLLHDSLIDAIRADRVDFNDESTQRWFAGVLRNRAAMTARSAARRTKREQSLTPRDTPEDQPSDALAPPPDFLASLPRAARGVADLALAGLRREEIVAALGIADTAFRQRLTSIRKAWDRFTRDHPDAADAPDAPLHPRPDAEFELGLIRRALLAAVRHRAQSDGTGAGAIGVHDPDGHLIVIGRSPASQSRAPRKPDHRKEN